MGLFPKDRDLSLPPEQVDLIVRASDFQRATQDLELRLDTFLCRHLHWRSRTSIQRLVHEGYVHVAGALDMRARDAIAPDKEAQEGPSLEPFALETRPGRRLRHGMRVRVVIPEELRVKVDATASGELVVLYEDDEVLAVDKPPLVPVHPSGRHLEDTLIQRVHARFRSSSPDGRIPVKLCHRLDRETSGIVLLAKDAKSHSLLMRQFEERQVAKEYLAIVWGGPDEDAGVIDFDLGPARSSRVQLKMASRTGGMPARTEWVVRERLSGCSLLSCRPLTGRQHQIRVHLEAIGHPIVGDKLYGCDEDTFLRNMRGELSRQELVSLGLPRHALHAHRLVVTSPRTGKSIAIESPLASDMAEFLERRRALRNDGSGR